MIYTFVPSQTHTLGCTYTYFHKYFPFFSLDFNYLPIKYLTCSAYCRILDLLKELSHHKMLANDLERLRRVCGQIIACNLLHQLKFHTQISYKFAISAGSLHPLHFLNNLLSNDRFEFQSFLTSILFQWLHVFGLK